MAELLSYAPDLRAITGGQGEYTMELVRYGRCRPHCAGRGAGGQREAEAVKA